MFQSILSTLVVQAGARWAMVVGIDGVLLETDDPSFRADAEGLAAEYAAFFRATSKAAGETDMGGVNRFLLIADQGKILLHPLTADYFLVLRMDSQALAGKACYEAVRSSAALEEELVY